MKLMDDKTNWLEEIALMPKPMFFPLYYAVFLEQNEDFPDRF